MRNFLSGIIDTLTKTNYQNIQDFNHINIKDDAVIVNLLSKIILPILLIFGFYVHSHGDYTPGGGFQAGIIFACALCGIAFVVFSSVARVFTTLLEALQRIEKTEKTNKIKSSKSTNSVNTQNTYTQHTVPANSSIAIAKVINNKV